MATVYGANTIFEKFQWKINVINVFFNTLLCIYVYIYIFTILCLLIHWFYWFWVLEIHIGNILHWTLPSYYTLWTLCTNSSITESLLHKHLILRYAQHNIIVAQKWLKYDVYYTKTRCVLQNNGRYYMFLLHK